MLDFLECFVAFKGLGSHASRRSSHWQSNFCSNKQIFLDFND